MSAKDARVLIAGGEGQVLDIRSDEQWESVGNIPRAVRASEDEAADAAKQIPEDRRVIVVCSGGDRSAEVAEKLRDDGRDAVSIDGGMKSWEDEGLALQPSADPDLPGDPGSVDDEAAGDDETAADATANAEQESSDQPPS